MTSSSESAPLAGLRVAVFESRMAGPTADLIAKHGGIPLSAPALREVPLGDSPEVTAFAEQLTAGRVRRRHLRDRSRRPVPGPGDRDADAARDLARSTRADAGRRARAQAGGGLTRAAGSGRRARANAQHLARDTGRCSTPICRSPACGLPSRSTASRASSWSRAWSSAGPPSPAYRSTAGPYPRTSGPCARPLARSLRDGSASPSSRRPSKSSTCFWSPRADAREADLRAAFGKHTVVGSIGPTTSETLRAHDLPVDIEPEHPKLGHLMSAVATGWRGTGKVLRK